MVLRGRQILIPLTVMESDGVHERLLTSPARKERWTCWGHASTIKVLYYSWSIVTLICQGPRQPVARLVNGVNCIWLCLDVYTTGSVKHTPGSGQHCRLKVCSLNLRSILISRLLLPCNFEFVLQHFMCRFRGQVYKTSPCVSLPFSPVVAEVLDVQTKVFQC